MGSGLPIPFPCLCLLSSVCLLHPRALESRRERHIRGKKRKAGQGEHRREQTRKKKEKNEHTTSNIISLLFFFFPPSLLNKTPLPLFDRPSTSTTNTEKDILSHSYTQTQTHATEAKCKITLLLHPLFTPGCRVPAVPFALPGSWLTSGWKPDRNNTSTSRTTVAT
ncbi:MAG: hypothetical protein J3R72DRAFT_189185 [Linnemannia gamsii]|nr:MAG: hypothetical protein J3R72DRAFT_189185 [Linnemannia gamsii]